MMGNETMSPEMCVGSERLSLAYPNLHIIRDVHAEVYIVFTLFTKILVALHVQ